VNPHDVLILYVTVLDNLAHVIKLEYRRLKAGGPKIEFFLKFIFKSQRYLGYSPTSMPNLERRQAF
jgi:hypothetical protein